MATPDKQFMQFNHPNSIIVGKITHIEGTTIAVSDEGHYRQLKINDPVYQNDIIRAAHSGQTAITFVNGAIYTMQPGASLTLDTNSLKQISAQAFPEGQQ